MPQLENFPTYMPVVAAAFVGEDGRWMMHRRPADKHHGGLWEFPGGKVETGETPLAALIREVNEELSVEIEEADAVPATFAQSPADEINPAIVILLYRVDRWVGEMKAVEGGKIDWFGFDRLQELPMPPLDQQLLAQLKQRR